MPLSHRRFAAQNLVLSHLTARFLVALLLLVAFCQAVQPARAAGVGAFGSNDNGQLGNGSTINSSTPVRAGTQNDFIQVSAGPFHSLALRSNGSVVAWGNNQFGQLGDGTTISSTTPVPVVGLSSGVKAISAGTYHSLAIRGDGSVVAWGNNAYGQLGNETTNDSSIPVRVSGLTLATVISAGGFHSLAISRGNYLSAWGNNAYGQLGNGTTTNSSSPVGVPALPPDSNVSSISAGLNFSVAVKLGTAVAWGDNSRGQLGDGTMRNSNVPVAIRGLTNVINISAGAYHAVGRLTTGAVISWGDNEYGQLGDGTTTGRLTAGAVSGLGTNNSAAAINAGYYHSFALKSDGTVAAWGRNDFGQLGNGTTVNLSTPQTVPGLTGVTVIRGGGYHTLVISGNGNSAPFATADSVNAATNQATSIDVLENDYDLDGNTITISAVTQGSRGSVAFTPTTLTYTSNGSSGSDSFTYTITDGNGGSDTATVTVYAADQGSLLSWGENGQGQLGDGTTASHSTPRPGGTRAVKISAGKNHSLALKGDGRVFAWGNNDSGQLGIGSTVSRTTPIAVSGLTGVTAISAGTGFSLALKSDGSVWAWGRNQYGQLGNGSNTSSNIPIAVMGLGGSIIAISAGGDHSLALRSNGTVAAWGYNGAGQLGNGNTTSSTTPVTVSGFGNGVIAVSAGEAHSLALRSNGVVSAWGDNSSGQLGNNTSFSSLPVTVSGLGNVTAISAGFNHSLALKNDGTAFAWGDNFDGQLGTGTTDSSSSPVAVTGLTGATALDAGTYYSLALKSDGSMMAWGNNEFGQLGIGSIASSSTPVTVNTTTGVGAISAGDRHALAIPAPSAAVNNVSLTEGNSGTKNFVFTVTRGGDSSGPASVNYTVGGGTALSSDDYGTATDSDGGTPGVLNFAANSTSGTIRVPVVGDSTFEGDETFNVTLSAPSGFTLLRPSVGVGTIVNDDLGDLLDVTRPGDPITPTSTNSPGGQDAAKAIDDVATSKYLNLDELNTGFTVTPSLGSTIVTGLRLGTGGDAPERDPLTFTLSGSNDGTNFTPIISNAGTGLEADPGRNTPGAVVDFPNTTAYTRYRIIFPTVRNSLTANSMQVGEVELLGRTDPTGAARLVVTTNADLVSQDGLISLREAVTFANSDGVNSAITFDGTVFDRPRQSIVLTSALPALNNNGTLSITAPAAGVEISGGNQFRVFSIPSGANVTLSGLTIRDGRATAANGGGILNQGTLLVDSCTLSANNADNGGAISSITTLTGVTLTLRNSTLLNNSASTAGGALYNSAGLTVIENCTITNNGSPAGKGSGVASVGDSNSRTEVRNSIISDNFNTDVDFVNGAANTFQSNGYNLIGDGNATGDFNTTGDVTGNTNPGLGGLADNGGRTSTLALLNTSPALNTGNTTLAVDQRGIARPNGAADDKGAFELALDPTGASALVVTTVADSTNPRDGFVSLREAINSANADGVNSAITFDATVFAAPRQTISLGLAYQALTNNGTLSITAPPAGVVISGNNNYRVFSVNSGANVTLTGLTIRDGNPKDGTGGGGILNQGTLLVDSCTLTANSATFDETYGSGGAILSITTNTTATIRNSTISGNAARTSGGGIFNSGTMVIDSCTITGNSAPAGKGSGVAALEAASIRTEVRNSIISGNTGSDVDYPTAPSTTFVSNGYNLIGGGNATSGFNASGDVTGITNPGLADLAENGGRTPTHALLSTSPAANSGDTSLTVDQRGVARAFGDVDDKGAFESSFLPPPVLTIGSVKLAEGTGGNTNFVFTVTRAGDTSGASSVRYSVAGGTATAGTDYGTPSDSDGASPGVLNFAANDTSASIIVPVVGDSLFEGEETFNVTLSALSNATLGSPSVGVGTITEDDLGDLADVTRPGDSITPSSANSPGGQEAAKAIDDIPSSKYLNLDKTGTGFTVTPSLGATIVTGLRLGTGGDAPERDPLTFTLSGSNDGTNFTPIVSNAATGLATDPGRNTPGGVVAFSNNTPYTRYRIIFPTVRNATTANSMQVGEVELLGRVARTLSIGAASVVEGNTGNGTVESGTNFLILPLNLSSGSTADVTVSYRTGNGIATAGTDFIGTSTGSLTILAGETTASIVVPILGDKRFEANETFTVTLTGASNSTFISTTTATGTITNDDQKPTLSINSVSKSEGDSGTSALTFTVSLSAPSDTATTVPFSTLDGSATAGSDYVGITSGSVTIPAGQSSATLSITINGDATSEGDESFSVVLGDPTAGDATLSSEKTGVGTILNDETPPTPATVPSGVTVLKSGTSRSRSTNRLVQTVVVQNGSGAPLSGPIYLAVDGLSGGTLYGASGTTVLTTPTGSAYRLVVPSGNILPVGSTIVYLEFVTPGNGTISYTPRVLQGPGAP